MKFIFGRQDMPTLSRAQENCFLLTNGLGGYASLSAAFSMTRSDQGMLIGARTAPNDRVTLVARLGEKLTVDEKTIALSSQEFADDSAPEEGYLYLSSLVAQDVPKWTYDVLGVHVTREIAMAYAENTSAVRYTLENRTDAPCRLSVTPYLLGFAKGEAPLVPWKITMKDRRITTNGHDVYLSTNGEPIREDVRFETPAYIHDAPDGRPEKGLIASICRIDISVQPYETRTLCLVFSSERCERSASEIIQRQKQRMQSLRSACGLSNPVARQLSCAADAFIAKRESTGGYTILAGYPFFGDWGRDTMIALAGCTLSTRRYADAKSILRTFLQYEKDGLVPNLFPEGTQDPLYNTVDAALLLINCIFLYVQRTKDLSFAREAYPVMERIVRAYQRGTHHGIRMDADGLIAAGKGLDQVTWMDVRIGRVLPTPRHGKPVEINAYWYNALKIMESLSSALGKNGMPYGALADTVKDAFIRTFWSEERKCLRDVISRTPADDQIRCNQIWALTLPFTMLSAEQERSVVDVVYRHLYTPCALRTLSFEDPQYHGTYGGPQKKRDMAYHQGTAWVFPLGAYYLAYLKTRGNTIEAAQEVREMLLPMEAALREGCIGQLPEIYDGDAPSFSRGCFAQAWSVGEILRVYEALEMIERRE